MMTKTGLLLLLVCLVGCGAVGEIGDLSQPGAGNGAPSGSTSTGSPSGTGTMSVGTSNGTAGGSTGGADGGATATTGGATGLPCDVQTLLSTKCVSCHGTHPLLGVPASLVTYADLTARSMSDPARTNAELAIARLKDTAKPMPPAGSPRPTAAEITALQNFVSAGYPKGSCGAASAGDGGVATADGGGVTDGGGIGGVDPFAAAPVCTSKTMWTRGNNGSGSMNPGLACIACHATNGAPKFALAGTLFPTAHEPDRCNGQNGNTGARVVITGANGQIVTLTPNSAGNFYYQGTVAKPYTAKVTYMGRERAMAQMQTSGDCNTCHTQNGGATLAPGRIIIP
jgi:hypothetical protein